MHCESVDDDTGVVDNWPLTFAESDDMVHAEQRASDVIEMGAMTTGAHAVQRASGDVIEALTTVAHAEQRVSSDMMEDEALGSAHAEERVHQGHVASVGASMGVEDLVEPAHAEQRMFGSDGCEVRSSVFPQADTDDPGHAEQRGPESGLLVGTQDQNEEPGSSHRMLAEDEFLLLVEQEERKRAVMSEAGQGEVVSLTPCVRQFTWERPAGVSMMVPVTVQKVKTAGVIDTAAQVTIMNSELREKLGLQRGTHDDVVMLRNAEKGSMMEGVVWKHVGFQLGGRKYYWDIVEADISDALILGIDFLQQHGCKIDLGRNLLEMPDGEKVYASMRSQETGVYHVSRVLVAKRVSIKPLSVTYVEARFEHPADVPFAVEPQRRGDLFMPSVMLNGSAKAWLCVLNMTDHQVTLKRNIELGCAVETDVLVVPREESNGGEQNKAVADVYLRGPVQDSEQEGLKVCSIKVSGDQETGLVMEDATTVEQDGKASSEPGGAVEQSGEMGEGHEQESVEISGEGNPEHKVAAGLSYVTELSAGTLAEEDPSVVHKSNKEVNQPQQAETRELPEHLQDLFDRAKELLTPEQAARVKKALLEFADVFAKTDLDIGRFTALVHYLKTGQAFPIKQSMRRTPLGFEKQEKATLDQMLSAGVIEHSHSEWASPPVLVRKRDGSWRYCIDFRAVNAVTEKDAYPLPLIEECLDSLAGKSWYCTPLLVPMWWKWLACWQRTFTVNYRGSPRRHRHCDSWDDSNDTLMTRLLTHVNRHTISILPQCTEDHVSRQLYNKDHLPLGWLSGGYSTQLHKQRQGLCGTSARSGFQVQSPRIFALLADPHPK